MIAKIFIPILLMIVFSDLYYDMHYLRYRKGMSGWKRLLWWMPGILMIAYTIGLASIKAFAPQDVRWLNVYLFLVGILLVPKFVMAVCSFLGWQHCKFHHTQKNRGNLIGPVLAVVAAGAFLYGLTIGPRRLEVKHIDLYFEQLPASFEGYKIVHFSDSHVGTFNHNMDNCLRRDIDSIKAQHADLIVFTGDLQNVAPEEITYHSDWYKELTNGGHTKVMSIMGNHDYSDYMRGPRKEMDARVQKHEALQRSLGWDLLLNEHRIIKRGKDSLFIAGEEWEAKEADDTTNYVNRVKTYAGIPLQAFVITLQHNPLYWEEHLVHGQGIPVPQLTLSGHTHAGQISLFGMRPTMLSYKEDYGLHQLEGKYLYVTAGLGGLVPIRIGTTPEIAVITLHRLKK